jgi:hypothetical protein
MKIKVLSFFSIAIIMIITTGCPYESNLPLGDPKDSAIDPELTGTWVIPKPGLNGKNDTVIIMRFNDHEYYFESHEFKNANLIITRGRAFITRINNEKILNLCELESPEMFFFAKYAFLGKKLLLSWASDQYIKQKFTSGREMADYFKTHIEKQGFFEASDTLLRVSE